jgi:hypothetical protein
LNGSPHFVVALELRDCLDSLQSKLNAVRDYLEDIGFGKSDFNSYADLSAKRSKGAITVKEVPSKHFDTQPQTVFKK